MSFSVEDFHDLVRLLDQHPEWRAELRRLVLTEELLGLPADVAELRQIVAELAAAQRQSAVELAELRQAVAELRQAVAELRQTVAEHTQELAELREVVAELAAAQRQSAVELAELRHIVAEHTQELAELRQAVAELREVVARLAQEMTELREVVSRLAQEMTELREVVARLARTQTEMRDQIGGLQGDALERRYREHASAYFDELIRRPRLLSQQRLADLLDGAEDAGQLTAAERRDVLLSDVVVRGRRRSDDAEAYLVVEVSVGIGVQDVQRAVRRAGLLGRLAPSLAAVAGEWITAEAEASAKSHGVWCVLDGQALPPDESRANTA